MQFSDWLNLHEVKLTQEIRTSIIELAKQKKTKAEIAQAIGVSYDTVLRVLKKAVLDGVISQDELLSRSDVVKKQWEDPEHREKVSQASKDKWTDPTYRAKMGQMSKDRWQDPAYQEKSVAAFKAVYDDPAKRAESSQLAKARWQDPAYRNKMLAILQSQARRDSTSASATAWWEQQGGFWGYMATLAQPERVKFINNLIFRIYGDQRDTPRVKEITSKMLNIASWSEEQILAYADSKKAV